ncbi:primase-like DNA-binding domain-containing protein, partial [Staphylococcus pseudintermedius]
DGYLEWRRIGLAEPKIIREQREEYRIEMDPIEMFLDECCELNPLEKINSSELYSAYSQWAKENHQYLMNNTKFGKEMIKKFERKKYQGRKFYYGLDLSTETKQDLNKFRLNL